MVQSYSPGGANVPTWEGTLAPSGKHDWTGASFGPPESTTQTVNQSVQLFLHRWPQFPYSLQWAPLFSKIAPSHGGSGPPSNTWFPEPIRAHKTSGISISSAVFAQMTTECPYTLRHAPFSPQNCRFPWRDLDPHLIHGFLSPPECSTQTASWSVQPL